MLVRRVVAMWSNVQSRRMPQRPLNEMDCDRTRSQTKHGRHRHFGHRGRTQLHPNQQQLCPSNTFCVKHVYTVRRTIPTATALAWQRGDSQTWHLAHHASRVANHQKKSRPHLEDRSLCFLSCIMNIRQSTDGMAATRCSIGCVVSRQGLCTCWFLCTTSLRWAIVAGLKDLKM